MKLHFNSYDNPLILSYDFKAQDFGAGSTITHLIPVPQVKGRGMGGRVIGGFVYEVTEDFAGSSQDGGVRVGDGSDDDKYFDSGLVLDEGVDVGEVLELTDDGSQVDIEAGRSSVTVSLIPTTGTPTGIASVKLVFAWWGGSTI